MSTFTGLYCKMARCNLQLFEWYNQASQKIKLFDIFLLNLSIKCIGLKEVSSIQHVWRKSLLKKHFALVEAYIWYLFVSLQEISKVAHKHGALVMVDNSIMSPVLSKPLDLGAGALFFLSLKLWWRFSLCCLTSEDRYNVYS